MCIRNLDTNTERYKANKDFLKGKYIEEFWAQFMTRKQKVGEH